jgi:hypothetical protein
MKPQMNADERRSPNGFRTQHKLQPRRTPALPHPQTYLRSSAFICGFKFHRHPQAGRHHLPYTPAPMR